MNEAAVKEDSYPVSGLHVHGHTRTHTHANTHTHEHTHEKEEKRISKGKYLFRKRRRWMNVSTLVFIRQPTQVSVRVKEKGCH